jgi:hypothetical protein
MISLGVLLVILGVGSLVLPSLGLQFTLMDWLDAYQPWVGIIVAAVGLITVLFGAQRRGRAEPAAVATAQASPPAEASPSGQASAPAQPTPPAERTWPTEPPEQTEED